MNPTTVRLEHAFLTVRNLEKSLVFYRRIFPEWTIRWEGRGRGGERWIHFGPEGGGQPSYLSLNQNSEAADVDTAYSSARIQHLGFAHPDVAGLASGLEPLGIRPADELIDDGLYRRAYFVDPDGHELEFVQMLKGE